MSSSQTKKTDVLSLQYALKELGYYPPTGKDRGDCPFTGVYGACTKKAVRNFQTAYGLSAVGVVGPATLKELNKLF